SACPPTVPARRAPARPLAVALAAAVLVPARGQGHRRHRRPCAPARCATTPTAPPPAADQFLYRVHELPRLLVVPAPSPGQEAACGKFLVAPNAAIARECCGHVPCGEQTHR